MPRANRHRRQESRSRRRRARRALNEFMLDDDDDLFDSDDAESPSWSSGTPAEMGDPPSNETGYVLAEAPKDR